jgi:tetratricopeptide (TPR) repeat protein
MFLFSPFLLSAQEAAKKPVELTKKERREVIKKINLLLKNNYVFPDKAIKIGNHLKTQVRKGAFKSLKDPDAFAKAVTNEMWSIFEDRHLRVRVRPPRRVQRQKRDPLLDGYLQYLKRKEDNYGFKTVKILEGNVGYLDFRYFGPVESCKNALASAMSFLVNTDAVIIDMRKNGGGSPGMVQLVCSYFFDKKVHLNSLYWRRGNYTQEFWTLDNIDGKKRPDVPLFVLTSKRTFSGAEEFSYNMLTRERATLIGEVTGGGANPGGGNIINDKFVIFIPTGRAINPVTKTNWEGTGVKPHIEIDAEKTFDRAHEEAKKAAADFRKQRIANATAKAKKIKESLDNAGAMFKEKNLKAGEDIVFKALKWGQDEKMLNEGLINALGYMYLGKKEFVYAIAVFKYNVKAFPESGNVYDSLGEAYKENGDIELAIKNYKKAFEIDPHNKNAEIIVKELKEK